MKKRQQVMELYYMRAIAAFGIFTIHATGGFALYSEFNSKVMHISTFLNQFFRFGTPVFMMISGFVLFYNYRTPSEFDAKRFYKKKAVYLIIPYTIWSIGYFFFKSYIYKLPIDENWGMGLINDILLGKTFSHLYFIFLIVQFYILFPLFIKYLSKSMMKKPIRTFVSISILQGILLIYEFYFRQHTNITLMKFIDEYYWKTALGWFYYFLTGGIIAYNYKKFVEIVNKYIKQIGILYILSTIIFLGEVYLNIYSNNSMSGFEKYGSIRPMNMIYGLMTFTILVWITRKIMNIDNIYVRLLKSFGTYSLGVYFAHPMVLEFIKQKLMGNFPRWIGYGRLSSFLLIYSLGWVITMGFCYIIALFEARWLLIGRVPKLTIGKNRKLKEA
jgi:surface polysaccharide O-acyltransferase-like enzyme